MKDKIFLLCLNSVKVVIALVFCLFEFSAWRHSFVLVLLLMLVDIANGKLLRRYFGPPKVLVRIFDSLADKGAIFIVIFTTLINHPSGYLLFVALFTIEGAKLLGGIVIYKKGILFFPQTWQKICLFLAGLGGIAFLLGYPSLAWIGILADFVSAAYYIKHSNILKPLVVKIIEKPKKIKSFFTGALKSSFCFSTRCFNAIILDF